jgi:hypothetical protein
MAGTAPRGLASTGVPHAILGDHERAGLEALGGEDEGKRAAQELSLLVVPDLADVLDVDVVHLRRDELPVVGIGPGEADRRERGFVLGEIPEKGEIAAGFRGEGERRSVNAVRNDGGRLDR